MGIGSGFVRKWLEDDGWAMFAGRTKIWYLAANVFVYDLFERRRGTDPAGERNSAPTGEG